MISEANTSINDINHSDLTINKRNGCLLKTFKIKPIKDDNNFLSCFSLEHIINSSSRSLTELTLQGCIRISSSAFCTNLVKLKILKALDVSFSSSIDDEVVKTICICCKSLEKLNLSYCNKLTEESVKLISCNLHNLQAIDLSYCYNIRPGCINNLYQSKMHKIDTIIAKGIAFESIDFQDVHKLKNLKTLSVNGCQLLDDRFLNLISKTCLENLDLKSNISFSTEGLLKMLNRLKTTLKLLYVDNVYSINRKLRCAISKLQPDEISENSEIL